MLGLGLTPCSQVPCSRGTLPVYGAVHGQVLVEGAVILRLESTLTGK